MVGLIVLGIVAASLYAIADSCQSGCGGKSTGCQMQAGRGCGQMGTMGKACGATSGAFSGAKVTTRAYYGGTVKMKVSGCPRGCSLMIAILKQGDRPDANATVFGKLQTANGRKPVDLQKVSPGVFCTKADLTGATALDLTVNGGGAISSSTSFEIPSFAATSQCGKMGAGCPMSKQAAGCKMISGGKCTGMAAGGCAKAGACKQAGKTAACKCAVCKCAPCKCK
jgi:hypothetical protein